MRPGPSQLRGLVTAPTSVPEPEGVSSQGEHCTPALGLVSAKGSARRESQAYGPWDTSGQQMSCFGLCDVFQDMNQQQQKKIGGCYIKVCISDISGERRKSGSMAFHPPCNNWLELKSSRPCTGSVCFQFATVPTAP